LIALHEFGTQIPHRDAYPAAVQVRVPAVSDPLVDTAPSVQRKVCEYVWVPPVTVTAAEVPASVLPLLKAERGYECPFTVCVETEQFAAAARVAVQVGATPPLEAEQVQFTEPPAPGNAGDVGEAVPAEQNVSAPNDAAENA